MYLFFLGLINGIVTGLVYSIEELWWGIFFCMLPFAGIVLTQQKTSGFVWGYGMGYHATGLAFLLKLSSMLPLPRYAAYLLMGAAILLAGFILTIFFQLVFWIYGQRRKRSVADVWLFAGAYILAEWLQGMIPIFAFPWFRPATVVAERPIFLQGSSLFGVLFVDFLIVLWNAVLARVIIKRRAEGGVVAALGLIAGVLLYGEVRLYGAGTVGEYDTGALVQKTARSQSVQSEAGMGGMVQNEAGQELSGTTQDGQVRTGLRVMLIQGNHEGREKWGMEITDILEDYMQIIEAHIDDEISLVVMPETALPYAIEEHGETKSRLLRICREYGVELLVGGIEKAGDRESYNAVYHVTSEGIRRPAYRKRILVPFGEYLPFAPLVERVCPWLMEFMTGNVFEAGDEEIIFETNIGRIGTLICFESVFSKAARETVEEGAQLLAIVSNDAWFEGTPAMRQHHAHAIIRAVETDRYILRVGNTGISSLIDNRGQIQVTMPENARGALKAAAALCVDETIYSEVGDVLPVFFSVLYVFVIIKKAGVLIFSHLSAIINR